ncbi:hypothetical protein McanCB56680_004142 [Microsporum canis]
MGQQKFSSRVPDKSRWKPEDSYSYLLYRLREDNLNNADGLFFRKNVKLDTVDKLLWQVILREQYCLAKSRVEKPTEKPTENPSKTSTEDEDEDENTGEDESESDENSSENDIWDEEAPQDNFLISDECELLPAANTMDMSDPWWVYQQCNQAIAASLQGQTAAPEASDGNEEGEDLWGGVLWGDDSGGMSSYMSQSKDIIDAYTWSQELDAENMPGLTAEPQIALPTPEKQAQFAERMKWLDNTAFQRENHS